MKSDLHKVTCSNISLRFSNNSEDSASELLEIIEMFPWYYMDSDVISRFKSPTLVCVQGLMTCRMIKLAVGSHTQYISTLMMEDIIR